jgi:hypothetical protein
VLSFSALIWRSTTETVRAAFPSYVFVMCRPDAWPHPAAGRASDPGAPAARRGINHWIKPQRESGQSDNLPQG